MGGRCEADQLGVVRRIRRGKWRADADYLGASRGSFMISDGVPMAAARCRFAAPQITRRKGWPWFQVMSAIDGGWLASCVLVSYEDRQLVAGYQGRFVGSSAAALLRPLCQGARDMDALVVHRPTACASAVAKSPTGPIRQGLCHDGINLNGPTRAGPTATVCGQVQSAWRT